MSKTTRATQALAKAGAAFDVPTYDYQSGAERIGLQAAAAIGENGPKLLVLAIIVIGGLFIAVKSVAWMRRRATSET